MRSKTKYHITISYLLPPLSPTLGTATDKMTIEELDPNSTSDHILEWLGGLSSYLPPTFDDPYNSGDFNDESWWFPGPNLDQELFNNSPTSFNSHCTSTFSTSTISTDPIISDHHNPPSDLSKKRKASDESSPKTSQISKRNQNRWIGDADDGIAIVEQRVPARRSAGKKKTAAKSAGTNCNNGNSKEGKWAEQLLNPCAAAITAGNLSRVQHFFYVLQELASSTGDANHRLADHGLQALKYHLSSPNSASVLAVAATFASTNPKFFKDSLINFNDIHPWFRIPNSIANSSILQILMEQDHPCNLHILDIGISHGVQWPTLLEELTRQPGGPPPLVRLTVVNPTGDIDQSRSTPFASGPPGYSFSSQLLGFAKAMNINLQINILDNHPLQSLNSEIISSSPDETLIVCSQFRLHNLNHNVPDDRTEFLRILKSMEPKGVILSENNTDCSCNNCGDFATGFSRRVNYLWRFLDSTSVAYKGRESDERRMMEGEAAKVLTNMGEMNERKELWCMRMRSVGFTGAVFREDTMDGARALLRKYDSNWEMRVEEKDGCLSLSWKGQPVSFCSLWKTDLKANNT